jgi:MerR family transcriptional regulator, light-induced transcriptional regulator
MASRQLRIGELARRTGISADALRAWERRYGVLRPARSEAGYRLYSEEDEARVQAMAREVGRGVPAAEAARLVLAGGADSGERGDFAGAADELRRALDDFDDARSQSALDALLAAFSFETVARKVILPYLRALGERWERGEASVAQEHFASFVLRGRLLALARGWDRGAGPRAVLACAPGERHELGLILFGLELRAHGWRITFLGADTPIETLAAAVEALTPEIVVVAALAPDHMSDIEPALGELAADEKLYLAGTDAIEPLAGRTGAELLRGDPIEAAAAVAAAARGAGS